MALYKRPNSKFWWMKFFFEGELVQQSTKCSNKRDALQVEAAFRHELALGRIGIKIKKDFPTFEQAVQDFLEWSKVRKGENACKRHRFSAIALQNYFGKTKVDRIEAKDIEAFIRWRLKQPSVKTGGNITRESVNHELRVFKMIFNRLIELGTISESPTRFIKQLPENERSFHVITPSEEKAYLLACPPHLQDVATIMLETGMRPKEVFSLSVDKIFFGEGYLQIEGSKTPSSNRKVHFTPKVEAILRRRAMKFPKGSIFPKGDVPGNDRYLGMNFWHLRVVRKLKFNFDLYDCRHTFATRAIERGVDLMTLAALLGHKDTKMLSRYVHPSEEMKRNAMRKMFLAKAV
ncbi:MAG: site-specific integrase [Acidobacteria bacterium]|nr:site-specific integrase [Acidobacteriota bacterium]MCA1639500.1 site-specific integrase [Acidobacteriota bacterium]